MMMMMMVVSLKSSFSASSQEESFKCSSQEMMREDKTKKRDQGVEVPFVSFYFFSFLSFALQRTHQRTSDVRCNYFNFSSSFLAIFIIVVCFVISIFFFLRFLQMMIFSFPSLSFLLCERDMNFAYI